MSAKEKAEELVERFENLQSNKMSDYSRIEYPTARLCASIVVKYILKELDSEAWIQRAYWLEVKKEIEEKL